MRYYIIRVGANLKISTNEGSVFIQISEIKGVQHVRDDMIKIDRGSCFNSLFIYYHDIEYPYTNDAYQLVGTISQWITDFYIAAANNPPDSGETF